MSSSPTREPATAEDLIKPPEAELGREVQFCPIQHLPIVQSLRVRTLPAFHLLSLDAGKEALARGFYTAFGEKFPCHNLEYLHPEDRVFICAEDNKAFLNEMSMRYHRYIGHELKERKAERKRLRERAEERKVRSAAHQAALQQQQQQQQRHERLPALRSKQAADERQERQHERQQQQLQQPSASQPLQMPASPPILPQQEPEPSEGIGGITSDGAPSVVTDDPYKATEDPYAGPTEDPYQVHPVAAVELASDVPEDKAAESTADAIRLAASAERWAPQAPAPTPPAPPAEHSLEAPSAAAASVAAPAEAAPGPVSAALAPRGTATAPPTREDLYSDICERDHKRQKVASVYATAIGSMLDDNFDEDD